MTDGWYLLVTSYAAAGVLVRGDRIREAAPIYRKLLGKDVNTLPRGGNVRAISEKLLTTGQSEGK